MSGTLGSRVRQLREARGLTQFALADKSGEPLVKIKDIEEGRALSLPLPESVRLATALEANLYYLEFGVPILDRRVRIPKLVRQSFETAQNLVIHAVRRGLGHAQLNLLWTKILEPPNPMAHRGVLSLSDIECYHERFIGPLPPLVVDKPTLLGE